MKVERSFRLAKDRDSVVERLCNDELLVTLMPGNTEIVESKGDDRRTQTHYEALGREGVATFDFTYLMDGNVRFEKVCDGKIWRKLSGLISVEEDGSASVVHIEMEGKTKSLVPEMTIKVPMNEQLDAMSSALEEHLG